MMLQHCGAFAAGKRSCREAASDMCPGCLGAAGEGCKQRMKARAACWFRESESFSVLLSVLRAQLGRVFHIAKGSSLENLGDIPSSSFVCKQVGLVRGPFCMGPVSNVCLSSCRTP